MNKLVRLLGAVGLLLVMGASPLVVRGEGGTPPQPGTTAADVQVTGAQGTAFGYRGVLSRGGNPVAGNCQFQFGLFDAASGGNAVASPQVVQLSLTNGVYDTQLDFGAGAFNGQARWLETAVICQGDSSPTVLPRQALQAVPYALYALNVNAANVAGLQAGSGLSYAGGQFSIGSSAILNAMLANGAVNAAKVDSASVQLRVTGTCSGNNFMQSVAADGTVTCGAASGGTTTAGSVTNELLANSAVTVTAGAGLSGGGSVSLGSATTLAIGNGAVSNAMLSNPSLTISAGNGLSGGGSVNLGGIAALSVDTATVQARVTGACAVGQYVTAVNADGTVTCFAPVSLEPVMTGGDFTLTGGPGTSR